GKPRPRCPSRPRIAPVRTPLPGSAAVHAGRAELEVPGPTARGELLPGNQAGHYDRVRVQQATTRPQDTAPLAEQPRGAASRRSPSETSGKSWLAACGSPCPMAFRMRVTSLINPQYIRQRAGQQTNQSAKRLAQLRGSQSPSSSAGIGVESGSRF